MKRWVVSLFVAGMVVVGVRGAVVAGWEVTGVDLDGDVGIDAPGAPYTFSATTSDFSQVTAQLTLGDGVNRSTATNQYGFKISDDGQTNSLAGAIALDHFIEFSITVEDGFELNLSTISMKGESAGSGCSNVVLMSSIDGFNPGNEISSYLSINGDTGGFDDEVGLPAAKFENLTGTVLFRLYGWGSTYRNSPIYIRNLFGDDLVLFGELVELPSSGELSLSIGTSNESIYVFADFDGAAITNYVLQSSTNMVSNIWNTVSTTFFRDTNWVIETTNSAECFRAIAQ